MSQSDSKRLSEDRENRDRSKWRIRSPPIIAMDLTRFINEHFERDEKLSEEPSNYFDHRCEEGNERKPSILLIQLITSHINLTETLTESLLFLFSDFCFLFGSFPRSLDSDPCSQNLALFLLHRF